MTGDFAELTLPRALRENARRQPDRVAIGEEIPESGIRTRGRILRPRATGRAQFRALGLSAGGNVAILSENRIEWVLAQLGANAVDAVVVGVYPTSPRTKSLMCWRIPDPRLLSARIRNRSTRC